MTTPTIELPPDWLERLRELADGGALDWPGRAPLPGVTPRLGAVLLLFGIADEGPDVLLTKRAKTLRHHPGQVSFPGGAVDAADTGATQTALREAQEETGVNPASVQILGSLNPLYLPPSNFLITPVVGWWDRPHLLGPSNPQEVARVVRVPLAELLYPANRLVARHSSGHIGPAFRVRGLFIWGFTAGLLDRICELSGFAQPWSTDLVVDHS